MEIRSLSLKRDQAMIEAFYARAGIRLDRGVTALYGAFEAETLLALGIYRWERAKFDALRRFICADDIAALKAASEEYDSRQA